MKEWKKIISQIKQPVKNRLVPEVTKTLTSKKDRQDRNDAPIQVPIGKGSSHIMYHGIDKVFLKPITVFNLLLRIKQPVQDQGERAKPTSFLKTPDDVAAFQVLSQCLDDTVAKEIGYEGELAHMTHSFESVEDMAVRIRITGYADKILVFIKMFLDIMLECAKPGRFEKSLILNAIETKKAYYANENSNVADHAANNRLLFLFPHTFHASLMEKALADQLEAPGTADSYMHHPDKFLKERILEQITSVQVLFFGNTSVEDAKGFCEKHIVKQFKVVPGSGTEQALHVGCLFPETRIDEETEKLMYALQNPETEGKEESTLP